MSRTISKPRKYFRRGLLGLLLLSFVFFSAIVTLRFNRSLHWYTVRNHTELLFQADILQYQGLAYFSGPERRHDIAQKLIQNTFYSASYAQPGMDILKENADDGYAPSQHSYGYYIGHTYPLEENKKTAIKYFEMAAAQGYEPAQDILNEFSHAP